MNRALRQDADAIVAAAIEAVLPDAAVVRALEHERFPGRIFLVAAGKAAWRMAQAACACVPIERGVVVTKAGHAMGALPRVDCYEGGHPVPNEGSYRGTRAALEMVRNLRADDTVLFLLSGGGSALFEDPLVPLAELQSVTEQLLASGADIVEINTIRKRHSAG